MRLVFTLTVVATAYAAYQYPEYCSKPGEGFRQHRAIPALSLESQQLNPHLLHVSTVLRHGARTPAERYDCWSGYAPQWDCTVQTEDRGLFTEGNLHKGLMFRKVYDAKPGKNILGGTCGLGHLLQEGVEQHAILGEIFGKYYSMEIPGLLSENATGEIYVRSSDMQRTLLSATVFLTELLKVSGSSVDNLVVHTMDEDNDYIYPNSRVCLALNEIREDMFASASYQELRSKYEPLEKKVAQAVGKRDISSTWPGELFDCMITAVCADHWQALPEAFRLENSDDAPPQSEKENLVNEMISSVNDFASYEYTWRKGTFSKVSIGMFMAEFNTQIVRALLNSVSEHFSPADAAGILADIIPGNALQEYYQHVISSIKSMNAPFDSKKLVIYGAHDTTLLAFLASLGSGTFGEKWPPYASQLIFELYGSSDRSTHYFRLIYNGKVITNLIPDCDDDLCNVSAFFKVTAWAGHSAAEDACENRRDLAAFE